MRYLLFGLLVLTLAGCESEPEKTDEPAPPIEKKPEPKPRDPPATPWKAPKQSPSIRIGVRVSGAMLVNGHPAQSISEALAERRAGRHTSVRVKVDPAAPWGRVRQVVQACVEVGVRNLHFQVEGEPPRHWPLPESRRSKRHHWVRLLWSEDAEETLYVSSSTRAGLKKGKSVPISTVVGRVRESKTHVVVLGAPAKVPFVEVHEAVEALRFLGTVVVFSGIPPY